MNHGFSAISQGEIVVEKNWLQIWIQLPQKPLIWYSHRRNWEIFFLPPKNGKAYSLAIFWGQKNFFELLVVMGVFEVAESESAARFSLRLFFSKILAYMYREIKIRNWGMRVHFSGSKSRAEKN